MSVEAEKDRLSDLELRLALAMAAKHCASSRPADSTQHVVIPFPIVGQETQKGYPAQDFAAALKAIAQLIEHGYALDDITPNATFDVRTGAFNFQPKKVQPADAPLPTAKRVKPAHEYESTELGNAEYFADSYRHVLRYDGVYSRWLEWRDHRWEPNGRAAALAQKAARQRLNEAVNMQANHKGKQRDEALRWAIRSESRYAIEAVLALADDMPGIRVSTHGWDADPYLLGTPGGVVDLRTGLRRDGHPDDYITRHAGVAFDPDAKCPRWEQFISEVLGGDAELITFMRRALGYTLSGAVNEDCWFGCFGEGRNGKSVLMKALHTLLGDYSHTAGMSLVQRGAQQGRPDFQHAYLQHRRLVIASETAEGSVWDEEKLKKLTGRDPIPAEIKYGSQFEFLPTHKLWFMFNHRPRVRDQSKGFWRRVRLIPFNQKFEGRTDDKHLDGKLAGERAGILTWLVRACLEWQRNGLPVPTAVRQASEQYQTDEDPLGKFIQQHARRDGPGFYLKQAYLLYKQWAKDEGVTHPLGRTRFASLLEASGFKRAEHGRGSGRLPFFENGTLLYVCVCFAVPCKCAGAQAP